MQKVAETKKQKSRFDSETATSKVRREMNKKNKLVEENKRQSVLKKNHHRQKSDFRKMPHS